jgi:predicted dehydrogenase
VGGTLEFESGAIITIVMSFDVARHRHSHIEIYGTEGALFVPDPNWFDGEIEISSVREDWHVVPVTHGFAEHDLRIMGAADMAVAIRSGRKHRASGALALHVLEVIEGLQQSSERGSFIDIASRPERPAALPVGLKIGEFD